MSGILCAGNLCVDILVRPVDQVRFDATLWVDAIGQSIGGNGANTSYTIARLGGRARLLGLVGKDAFAEFVRDKLADAGVDLAYLGRSDHPTATTVVLVNSRGARAFLHHPGASAEAFSQAVDFTADLVGGSTHFHLANIFSLPMLRPRGADMLARARRCGLTTSLDTGWDSRGEWLGVAGPCLPHLDLLFVNRDEARLLSGHDQPQQAARLFRDRGVRSVIVKLGGDGCSVFSQDTELHVAGLDVPVVDTTGAGDCFAGAFLAALQQGASLRESAELANAVGALNVQSLGAVAGVRTLQETREWMTARVPSNPN